MLFLLPLWATILISIASLFCFFIVFKSIGLRILTSIALSSIVSDIIVIMTHPFDVENGIVNYHDGDIYVAIYLIISIIYYIGFGFYFIFKKLIKKYCCCKEVSKIDKIKEVYDNMSIEEKILLYDVINEKEKVEIVSENFDDNLDSDKRLPVPLPSPNVSGRNYDFRNMNGILITNNE
jgi:hypothetical protein